MPSKPRAAKPKKTPKPQKTRKPLTSRKSVQEANRKMVEFFSNQLQNLRKATAEMEERVAKSNSQLWSNQEKMHKGLGAAEEHVVLIRRVLNDALSGVTRVTTVVRKSQTDPGETEEVQVIDWGWYGEQLYYSDDPQTFVNGEVLTEDEIKERAAKERIDRRNRTVFYLVGKAAEQDEAKLREAFEADDMDELLKQHLPQGVEWEEEMHLAAPSIAKVVLRQREAARRQQEQMKEAKERELLKMSVQKLLAKDLLGDPKDHEKLVRQAMPTVIEWTPRMSENLPNIIEEVFAEEAKKHEENDPEEVEAAKQELLEETKKFGEKAAEVIKLIEEGKEDEARAAMTLLEQKVKDKEAEAERTAPYIPDGATVFGE